MPDLTTPDLGAAGTAAAPLTEADVPTPNEVRELVGGIPCEVSAVSPCTKRHPQNAAYIIIWAECNCDPMAEGYEASTPICQRDWAEFVGHIRPAARVDCPSCGFVFMPGRAMVKEVIYA